MDAKALFRLLRKNRGRNERLGITGLLLYRDGAFMEVIEGEEDAVRRLFGALEEETHHRDMTALYEGAVDARSFRDWSMSFHHLGDLRRASIPGFSPFADPSSLADQLPAEAGFSVQAARSFMRTNPQYPDSHTKPA